MINESVFPPDLTELLKAHKRDISDTLNCIQIGKIESFDKTTQSAKIQLQIKRVVSETEIKDCPLLVDCPVIYLQGGGAYIDMPITAGDYCLVLFNDKDIDTWWTSANVKEPNSGRCHNLSDGFALVGINPKTKVLGIDGTKIGIMCNNKQFQIKNAIGIDLLAATESFVKGDTLYNQLLTLITALQTFTTGLNPTTLAAQASTMATACGTALGLLNQIKSTKIKGE